jgi:hypothetical protein
MKMMVQRNAPAVRGSLTLVKKCRGKGKQFEMGQAGSGSGIALDFPMARGYAMLRVQLNWIGRGWWRFFRKKLV